jgi:hypothetical protein
LIYDGLRHMFGGSSFPPGLGGGSLATPPTLTDVYDPSSASQDQTSIGEGGSWRDDDNSADDSADNDDDLSEGGDFDTDSDDGENYDDGDAF